MNRTQLLVLTTLIIVSAVATVGLILSTMELSPFVESSADAKLNENQGVATPPAAGQQEILVVNAAANYAADVTAEDAAVGAAGEASSADTADRGQLNIGVARDLEPFSHVDAIGHATGFEIELAQALARRWLNDQAPVSLLTVTPSEAGSRLAKGDVDIVIASLVRTHSNADTVDFSQPYFLSRQGLLLPADAWFGALQDLQGATVAVVSQSTSSALLAQRARKNGITLELLGFNEYGPAVDALLANQVAAVAGDSAVLDRIAAGNSNVKLADFTYGDAHFSIAMAPSNNHLREMVNYTLQDMKSDGYYDALVTRWFPNTEPYDIHVSGGFWPYSFASLPNVDNQGMPATYQMIRNRGKIVAGIDINQPPFGLVDGDGNIAGFEAALVRGLAQSWLGDDGAVEFVTGSAEEQIDRLAAGEIDLVAAAIDNERDWADLADFSQPYVGPPATDQFMRFGLPQYDHTFRQLVDYTLQQMQEEGRYADLSSYWLGAGTPTYALEAYPAEAGFVPLAYSAPASTLGVSATAGNHEDSTVARVRARNNVLLAGVKYDFSPFGVLNETGQVVGFDVDLVQAMADGWGIEVEFLPVTSANRIQKLADGEVDLVAASMTHTQGRDADIDFSQTYFADGQALLVRRNSGISDIRDLDGLPVAAIEGSTSIIQINDHAAANGVAIEIVPFQGYPIAVDELLAGNVAAVTTDSVALQQFARENPDLHVVGELFTHEPYGLGLHAGDATFAALVNDSLQSLKESGVYDELYAKWFGNEARPYPVETMPGRLSYSFADAPVSLNEPAESRVDKLLRTGLLVAGVNQDRTPFGYLDEAGEPAGFEIDIVREFAARWLGDPAAVEFAPLSDATDLLQSDAVDLVAASLPHIRGRYEQISLSQTYYRDLSNGANASGEPYAIGLPRYDHRFRDLINFTLQEMKTDGTYDRLFRKWFGETPPYPVEVWPGASYLPVGLTPMVKVPGGSFIRGSDKGLADEQPVRTIFVDSFYIDRYEVSNRHYDLCVRAGACNMPRLSFSLASGLYYADPAFHNFPAIWVTWDDAVDYCAYVGKRLPTESEWEKVARGTDGARYPWGNDEPNAQTNFNYILGDLAEVGTYALDVSPYGVNDIAGNVREWTADWYNWDSYRESAETNPTGPPEGTTRVVRGGAWDDNASALRSSARRSLLPTDADANLGFRCAGTTPPSR